MPASRMPPNPGEGSVGSHKSPSATRRVGATAREWRISSSASSTARRYFRTGYTNSRSRSRKAWALSSITVALTPFAIDSPSARARRRIFHQSSSVMANGVDQALDPAGGGDQILLPLLVVTIARQSVGRAEQIGEDVVASLVVLAVARQRVVGRYSIDRGHQRFHPLVMDRRHHQVQTLPDVGDVFLLQEQADARPLLGHPVLELVDHFLLVVVFAELGGIRIGPDVVGPGRNRGRDRRLSCHPAHLRPRARGTGIDRPRPDRPCCPRPRDRRQS